jgi:class 3 adenylate cyclase/tetratricopeptide (TPR) repeat protein
VGAAPRGRFEAERRHLTVLFCDLVGSTALAIRLDPEELREVIRAYQRVCAEAIERFEGHIAQYLGDGLLVYFGYPQAHEDDGQRAASAALGMVEAMARLNQRLEADRGIRLAIRVGIHTGVVVVGAIGGHGHQEQLALGDTPNVAARLQGLASPDTIVVSAATQRLIQSAFACQELGTHAIEGVPTPVQVFRVVGERDPQSRVEAGGGLTTLVGREEELGLLLEHWGRAKDGQGQVVVLSGEAGVGKSRLVQVVRDRVAGEGHICVEWRSSPYHQQSPFYPVIAYLRRLLRWRSEETPAAKLRKLEALLTQHGYALAEAVPLFASLLTLPLPEHYQPVTLAPQRQKSRTLEALLAWRWHGPQQGPILFAVEDLHWLDPSTLELLDLLIERAPPRLLTLLTCRPAFRPRWAPSAQLSVLTLSRLPRPQAALMVERVAGAKAVPIAVREQLLDRADGVPLFIEELTKMILESGFLRDLGDRYELTGPLPPLAIPATLHDSLVTRLDRWPAAKPVAQLGATIGRQFSFELLQAVAPVQGADLEQALGQLVEAELLYQRGLLPAATYTFKHALIQEAAYQSLLRSTRQQYHQRIAQALAERFPETAETQPELMAHHYTEAGLASQAVPYWHRAGQRALERSANLEAISHLTRGLDLLKTMPEGPERAQRELTLHLALGAPLLMIKGYPAPEVEQTYTRALELCEHVGDSAELFSALTGLWGVYLTRPRLRVARDLAERSFGLAQRLGCRALLQEANLMLGASLFYLGDLRAARAHLEEGIALYQRPAARGQVITLGADPGARCLAWYAWTLWTLGYPAQALARMNEALPPEEEVARAFTRAWVLHFAATLHAWRGEFQLTQERAEAEIAISSEQGFVRWVAGGMIRRGWALAMRGAAEEGLAQLNQGVATWPASAGELGLTSILAQQAEVYGCGQRPADGLRVVAEALAFVEKNEERYYEAELHRLRGELLLQGDPLRATDEVERCFARALEVARGQGAKLLELRAALSLSQLWRGQGKVEPARELLGGTYRWFTEGFDTRDLREARALLQALA